MHDEALRKLTARIVGAYVHANPVPTLELPTIIASVCTALLDLGKPATKPDPAPAVNPKKSVHPDYLISLEDGRRFKSLKRHLMAKHGLTPDAYRKKWGLPPDYPMVAPNYSAAKSAVARKIGLGGKTVAAKASKARRSSAKRRST